MAPIPLGQIVRSTNKTGVSGVQCRRAPDGQVRCWVARTQVDDVCLRRAFFVSEHGDAPARALAVAERHQQVERARALAPTRTRCRLGQGKQEV